MMPQISEGWYAPLDVMQVFREGQRWNENSNGGMKQLRVNNKLQLNVNKIIFFVFF